MRKKYFFLSFFALLAFAFTVVSVSMPPTARAGEVLGIATDAEIFKATAAAGNDFATDDIGYINSSNQVVLANALNASSSRGMLAIAMENTTGGTEGIFRTLDGFYTMTGLVAGSEYFLDTVDGQLTTTPPTAEGTVVRSVGYAYSSTQMYFKAGTKYSVVATGTAGGGGSTGGTTSTPTVEASSVAFESDGTITNDVSGFESQAGDLILAFAATDQTDATESTYTPDTGFATLIAQQRAGAGGAGTDFGSWYKVAGVSEPASYDLGESELNNTAAVYLLVSGLDSAAPINASACSTGTTEPVTAPSIDVTVDDALVLTIFAWDGSKTVVLEPDGFTTAVHSDNSGVDLWVGYENQATAGASGTNVMDLSGNDEWVACTIALKEPNATSTGGGTADTEGAGPFSLLDDGSGNNTGMKITIAETCSGGFSGSACEIHPNNSPSWQVGDPDLATWEHPTYFIRDPNFYTFCSPNDGATTATASNGRSELRYLFNWSSGVIDRQWTFRLADEDVVDGLKANIGQLHRGCTEASPFKFTYTHDVERANTAQAGGASTITLDASANASNDYYNGMGITITSGTGVDQAREITDYDGATKVATVDSAWNTQPDSSSVFEIGNGFYRLLIKRTDGASDYTFPDADYGQGSNGPIGLGNKYILDGMTSNSCIRVRRQYDISAQTFKVWASNDGNDGTGLCDDTILTGAPLFTVSGVVLGSGSCIYEKDGMYMNDEGTGSPTTPYCVEYHQSEWTLGQDDGS